jgi:hypothetical protein
MSQTLRDFIAKRRAEIKEQMPVCGLSFPNSTRPPARSTRRDSLG